MYEVEPCETADVQPLPIYKNVSNLYTNLTLNYEMQVEIPVRQRENILEEHRFESVFLQPVWI